MRYRTLLVLAALKVMLLASWFTVGYVDSPREVFAEAPLAKAGVAAPSGAIPVEKGQDSVDKGQDSVEKGFLEAIQRRQAELDLREEELRTREDRLSALSSDIDASVLDLKKLQDLIEAEVRKLEEANDDRIKRTVKIYESMEAEEAASRLEKLSDGMAVLILSSMNPKKAGAVLGLVDLERAVKLTHLLKIKKN